LRDVASAALEKCTRLLALIVAKNVKFRSSQPKASQSTAEIAIKSTGNTR
jgi:hypothetical protein